jgi:hypothetical protein
MPKIKYGVFTRDHTRGDDSIDLSYQLNHFKGQLVLSDNVHCLSLNGYWVDKQSVHEVMFSDNKDIDSKLPKSNWFELNKEPITWFDSYEKAQPFIKTAHPISSFSLQT